MKTSVPDPLFRANPSANLLHLCNISQSRPSRSHGGESAWEYQPRSCQTDLSIVFTLALSPAIRSGYYELMRDCAPALQGRVARPTQGPYDRIRMSRKGRTGGGMSPIVLPDEDVKLVPRE